MTPTVSTNGKNQSKARDDREATIAELERQLEYEKDRSHSMEDRFKSRLASYMKRDGETKCQIESLEKCFGGGIRHEDTVQKMALMDQTHKSIVAGIESVQVNTARILQEQSIDAQKMFHTGLQKVKDHESQRNRSDGRSVEQLAIPDILVARQKVAQEMIACFDKKNRQLSEDNQKFLAQVNKAVYCIIVDRLRAAQELVSCFRIKHHQLCDESRRLLCQLAEYGDKRHSLLQELMASRKELACLKEKCENIGKAKSCTKYSIAETSRNVDASRTWPGRSTKTFHQTCKQPSVGRQHKQNGTVGSESKRLESNLEEENLRAEAGRQRCDLLLTEHDELQAFLMQCISDIQQELEKEKAEICTPQQDEVDDQVSNPALIRLQLRLETVQLMYNRVFSDSPQQDNNSGAPKMEPPHVEPHQQNPALKKVVNKDRHTKTRPRNLIG